MKLVFSEIFSQELKEYLLEQNGIVSVEFTLKDYMTEANIEFNDDTNPEIIMKHIELFQKHKYSYLWEFDKGYKGDFKTLKHTITDMCCEYCYQGLIMDLFENKKIKSVTSNYNLSKDTANKPASVEIIIEYTDCDEQELIDLINQSLGREKE